MTHWSYSKMVHDFTFMKGAALLIEAERASDKGQV
jgi:hypothetical protein